MSQRVFVRNLGGTPIVTDIVRVEDGNVYLGPDIGEASSPTEASLIINQTDDDPWTVKLQMWNADTSGPAMVFFKSNGATVGTQTVLTDGETMGEIWFAGSDGTELQPAAFVHVEVDGTAATDNMPSKFVWGTRADGSTVNPVEKMSLDNAGHLILADGGAAAQSIDGVIPKLQVQGTDAATAATTQTRWSNNDGGPGYIFGKSKGSSIGSHTAVANNDTLAFIDTLGSDGTGFVNAALLKVEVDGAVSSGNVPGRFMFFISNTSGGLVERVRISNTTTATHTSLMLWDVDNGTLERVTVGAADSGGAGFKVLRIPN